MYGLQFESCKKKNNVDGHKINIKIFENNKLKKNKSINGKNAKKNCDLSILEDMIKFLCKKKMNFD